MFTFGKVTVRGFRAQLLGAPALLLLVPLLTIGAHWIFGDLGLYSVALGLPLIIAAIGMTLSPGNATQQAGEIRSPFDVQRAKLEQAADQFLQQSTSTGRNTACILLSIDDFHSTRERLGMRAMDQIHRQVGERLCVFVRQSDTISSFGDGVFGIILAPVARADLETLLQITGRLQKAVSEPMVLAGTHIHLTVSVGFSQPDRVTNVTGSSLVETAEAALREANIRGPGTVRAYTSEMHRRRMAHSQLTEELRDALELGQIVPWFQPQISTDTGHVSGFEALARWLHPTRGMIPPAEFLPVVEDAGLLERLGEVMLFNSFAALRAWDQAGIRVPTVGVNFSSDELRNPNLVDKIAWELDRFGLEPNRLTVEVLENVIADGADDTISHNITALSNLGCCIDLDDFGTGHASITNIRRFTVSRLKIDRSFVLRVHEDREQQRMVAAILTMAERLELDTLAEGVETVGEHTMLAQLGCRHVQGFGIGRPIPFEDTIDWLMAHHAKLAEPPTIGRRTG